MARLVPKPLRSVYLLIFIGLLVLYSLFPTQHSDDASTTRASSSSRLMPHFPVSWGLSKSNDAATPPLFIPPKPRAAFVLLLRNGDLGEILPTLGNLEETFNAHPYTAYPYIFLNDEAFTPYFRGKVEAVLGELRKRYGGPNAPTPDVRWGEIPSEQWQPPAHINWDKARKSWKAYEYQKLPYATSLSYRNMCRWQSGFFFKHPLLMEPELEFYWRIEPSTRYTCNLVPSAGGMPQKWDSKADGHGDFFDPFRWMKANKKKYGWVLSLKEYQPSIRTLWPKARMWMLKHPEYLAKDPGLDFILKEDKIGYNLCHFWSNFEIADLSFFRSQAYQDYFDFLEKDGMFYHERTGDAPVHTIAAAWFLNKSEIHQFDNIGYRHAPFSTCPQGDQFASRCTCDKRQSFKHDVSRYGCQ